MVRQILKEADLPPEVLIQSEGDTRYLQQSQADARYPLRSDTDPYPQYHNQARADARYLQLTGGAVSGALTVGGKAVAASPDGGNALEFRSNGFYAGGGGGGSFSSIRDEEFAPAAAATSVVLAATPVNIVMVSRNGVVQSQAAGNYSLAGSTLTFTDAFVAGERVAVVYEIGVAAGDLAYTKNDSDLRFVNIDGDTMTGNLQVNANVGVGITPAAWKANRRGVQVGLAGSLTGTNDGSGVNLQENNYEDATGTNRSLVAGAASSYNQGAGVHNWYTAPSVAAGAPNVFTQRMRLDQAGNLGVGVAPAAWVSTYKTLQLGLGGAVVGPTDAANLFLNANAYQDGSGWKAINAGGGVTLQLGVGGTMTLFTAPTVAAGAAQTFATRLTVDDGSMKYTPAASGGFMAEASAGEAYVYINAPDAQYRTVRYAVNGTGAQRWMVGTNPGSANYNVFRYNDAGAFVNVPFSIDRATGTVTLTPDAGQPALSLPSWAVTPNGVNFDIKYGAESQPASLRVSASGLSAITGHWMPLVDNAWGCGIAANRWAYVYATNGTIQTSHVSMKQNFAPLDPAACVEAVLGTDWLSFEYKPSEAAPLPLPDDADEDTKRMFAGNAVAAELARKQKGFVLGSEEYHTADLFGQADRRSASPSSDLAVVACALQQALKDIADLKARLA